VILENKLNISNQVELSSWRKNKPTKSKATVRFGWHQQHWSRHLCWTTLYSCLPIRWYL